MQRAFGLEVPENLEDLCRPDRMAPLVYDMQVGIVRHIADSTAFVARVGKMLKAARGAGMSLQTDVATFLKALRPA